MTAELTRVERDDLIRRVSEAWDQLYPKDKAKKLADRDFSLLRERVYQWLAEYSDRLPRVRLSVCPFCAEELKRSIDPFGLDGPWWHVNLIFPIEEPRACEHFRVLLGAYRLGRDRPVEAKDSVRPGPDVPFVVPALLGLPGMVAVVGEIAFENKDRAFPIAYFSDQETPPEMLHQPWLRDQYWFKDAQGQTVWTVANDEFDFELTPYLRDGRLRWVDLRAADPVVQGPEAADRFPWTKLEGQRLPQLFSTGKVQLLALPTGETLVPFGEPPDPEEPDLENEAMIQENMAFLEAHAADLELTPEDLKELEEGTGPD